MARGGLRRIDATSLWTALGMGVSTSLYGVTVWSPAMVVGQGDGWLFDHLGTVSSLVHALVLALVAVGGARAVSRGRSLAVLGPLAVGVWCLAFALWLFAIVGLAPEGASVGTASQTPGLFWLASPVTAAAIGLSMVVWSEVACDAVSPLPKLIAAAAVVAAVTSMAMAACPPAALRGTVLLLLFLESVLLGLVCRRPEGDAAQAGEEFPELARLGLRLRRASKAFLAVMVACVVTMIVAPLTNTVIMADVLQGVERYAMSALACGVAAAVFVVAWGLPRRTPSSFNLLLGYNACLLGLLVAALFAPALARPLLIFGSMGFFLTWFMTCEASVGVAREHAIPRQVAYAAAAAVAMVARLLADGAASAILASSLHGESKTLVAVFLLIYLATCALFLLYGVLVRRRLAYPSEEAEAPGCPNAELEPAHGEAELRAADFYGHLGLSRRETEVLDLIMHGRNVPAIAEELSVSRNTVQTHVRHIYEQLGVHSRRDLVSFVTAVQSGQKDLDTITKTQ